jgi:hypothetical protein
MHRQRRPPAAASAAPEAIAAADGATSVQEGMPRWVKVSGLVALLVLAAVAVLHLTGNSLGGHG